MSDLDDFMDRDLTSLTKSDIDEIIQRQRQHRARLESGVKTKKDTGPKLKLDLVELGLVKPKPIEVGKRRF